MNLGSVALTLATALVSALVSGITGYALGQPDPAPPCGITHTGETARAGSGSTSPPANPVIAVGSDGNVTLHVDQQPLEWVLEQIALQGGDMTTTAKAVALRPPSSAGLACQASTDAGHTEPAQLLQAIERGSEAQRVQGLLDAQSAGVFVPDSTLKVLFETDASERVRLHAFEAYLERRTGDNAALRRTLEAATLIPSALIQREAQVRLHELTAMERMEASFKHRAGS